MRIIVITTFLLLPLFANCASYAEEGDTLVPIVSRVVEIPTSLNLPMDVLATRAFKDHLDVALGEMVQGNTLTLTGIKNLGFIPFIQTNVSETSTVSGMDCSEEPLTLGDAFSAMRGITMDTYNLEKGSHAKGIYGPKAVWSAAENAYIGLVQFKTSEGVVGSLKFILQPFEIISHE